MSNNNHSFGKFREFFLAKENSPENCSVDDGNPSRERDDRTFLPVRFYAISRELRPPAETPIFFTRESFSASREERIDLARFYRQQQRWQSLTTITRGPFFFPGSNPPLRYPFILIVN